MRTCVEYVLNHTSFVVDEIDELEALGLKERSRLHSHGQQAEVGGGGQGKTENGGGGGGERERKRDEGREWNFGSTTRHHADPRKRACVVYL